MSTSQPTLKDPIPPPPLPSISTTPRTTSPSLDALIYLTLFLLLLSVLWFCYVLGRIQIVGKYENWTLPPLERKSKRKEERGKVVGVRWIFIPLLRVLGGIVGIVDRVNRVNRVKGDGAGERRKNRGQGGEFKMEERNRLERMHIQRRAKQKSVAMRKQEILREIERLKAEDSFSSSSHLHSYGHGETNTIEVPLNPNLSIETRNANTKIPYDVEAQPALPQVHPQRSKTATQIRHLQEELQELEDSPEASNIPTQSQLKRLPHIPHFLTPSQLPRTPSLESINLNSPPSGETVTDSEGDTTLVNASERRNTVFHHPCLTSGRFNTPESPSPMPQGESPRYLIAQHSPTPQSLAQRQGMGFPSGGRGSPLRHRPNKQRHITDPENLNMNMNTSKAQVPTAPHTSENTWRYNDSDSDNDNAGDEEVIFTLFAARAREFEAGDPVPRRRIRGPSAENTGNADEVPNSLMAAGSARPGTPQVGDERRLANDYMEERRVASEGVTERQQEAGSVLERPGNAYLPREMVGTFLVGDSEDEAEESI